MTATATFTRTALTFTVAAGLCTACAGASETDQTTPAGALTLAFRALEDGRYADACAVMYEASEDCATDLANTVASGGGDLDGIGDVKIAVDLIEIDGDTATIPAEALSWAGGRSYPYIEDETLHLDGDTWWLNQW